MLFLCGLETAEKPLLVALFQLLLLLVQKEEGTVWKQLLHALVGLPRDVGLHLLLLLQQHCMQQGETLNVALTWSLVLLCCPSPPRASRLRRLRLARPL